MNKRTVNEEIDVAYEVLKTSKIADGNKINKAFRGQISSFGAAAATGSLPAAIAFFSDQGGASVERTKLMKAIFDILVKKNKLSENQTSVSDKEAARMLFNYAKDKPNEAKEEVMNAAIALKLAMNLYELKG